MPASNVFTANVVLISLIGSFTLTTGPISCFCAAVWTVPSLVRYRLTGRQVLVRVSFSMAILPVFVLIRMFAAAVTIFFYFVSTFEALINPAAPRGHG